VINRPEQVPNLIVKHGREDAIRSDLLIAFQQIPGANALRCAHGAVIHV
jgi:hypothetical protein